MTDKYACSARSACAGSYIVNSDITQTAGQLGASGNDAKSITERQKTSLPWRQARNTDGGELGRTLFLQKVPSDLAQGQRFHQLGRSHDLARSLTYRLPCTSRALPLPQVSHDVASVSKAGCKAKLGRLAQRRVSSGSNRLDPGQCFCR